MTNVWTGEQMTNVWIFIAFPIAILLVIGICCNIYDFMHRKKTEKIEQENRCWSNSPKNYKEDK